MLTRIINHPLKRFQSKYVLAEVVNGKLVEAKFKKNHDLPEGLAAYEIRTMIGSPKVEISGKSYSVQIDGINPILEKDVEGSIKYFKIGRQVEGDWYGYMDKYGEDNGVLFKFKYNGGVETSPVDKEKKYKYDIAGNFQTNRDSLAAINITEISG